MATDVNPLKYVEKQEIYMWEYILFRMFLEKRTVYLLDLQVRKRSCQPRTSGFAGILNAERKK